MAAPSLTYTLTNGTTADASQVQQNFNDILNGITDGTKDLSISALTCAGTATLNGHVNLGNSSADDLTITASLASTIPIKTTNTYNIGSSTLGLAGIYFGANSQTARIIGSGSMSATWTLTLPVSAGTANYLLITDGSGVSSWSSWTNSAFAATTSARGTVQLPNAYIFISGGAGHGSTNTHVRRFTSANEAKTGTAITYASSATNGDTFTVSEAGIYAMSYTDNRSGAGCNIGISLNSAQLTTSVEDITASTRLALVRSTATEAFVQACAVWTLAANDVIRAHTDSTPADTSGRVSFRITQLVKL